jgi:hypothetical protein
VRDPLPPLNIRRFAQSHAQGAEAINRAAGQGSGYGLQGMALLADQYTAPNQLFTGVGVANAVDLTGSATVLQVSRPMLVLVQANIWLAVTAGIDFFYAYIQVDAGSGAAVISGDGPKGYYSATALNVVMLQPGAHTAKVRGYVGAAGTTGKIVQAEIFAFATIN